MLIISQVHSLLSVIRVLKRSNPVQVIVQNASEGCFFFPLISLVMCSQLRMSPGWYKSKNPRKHIPYQFYRVQCIQNTVLKKGKQKS